MRVQKRSLALAVALILGVASAVASYIYLQNLSTQKVSVLVKPETRPVVVALADIPAKTALTSAMLTYAELPVETILAGSIDDLEDAVGLITKTPLMSGEVIHKNRLWPQGVTPGLTFQIPPGKRAITIGVNEVIGVAGFVKPGDYVDILATIEAPRGGDVTSTILQHGQVLAIAQQTEDREGGEAKVTTTLTLAVTLDEAARLTLAEERGVLRVVLRPAEQHDQIRVNPVTTDKLLTVYNPVVAKQGPQKPVVTIKRLPATSAKPIITKVEVIRGTNKEIVEVIH